MSNPPDNKHPWAKFDAKTAPPRRPAPIPVAPKPSALPPKPVAAPVFPLKPRPMPLPTMPPSPAPEPAAALLTQSPFPLRPVPVPVPPAMPKPVEPPGKPVTRPPFTKPAAPAAPSKPKPPPGGTQPQPAEPSGALQVADALAKIAAENAPPPVRIPVPVEAPPEPPRFWLWKALHESAENSKRRAGRAGAWWGQWRKSATFPVVVAFVALYVALAMVRAPSEAAREGAQRSEELAFLQNFLKSYCQAGGTVFTERRRGGNELYPRGVVLQGELLDAFRRAPVGANFVTHVRAPAASPLAGFDHYPPVFVNGTYFELTRKFNFTRYRFSFLVRKDSEAAGALLVAKVEQAL